MRNPNKWLAAALAATTLLAGCTSTPSVRSDYDKSANFAAYHSFGFLDQGDQAKSLAMQTLEAAATREMEARGYKLSPEPDLLVNFTGKLQDRTDVQSVPGPMYGVGWGYGGWYGAPYGGWNSQQVTTRHYKVGTLVMDVVDQALNAAVARLFTAYPFVAGQSAPVTPPDQK